MGSFGEKLRRERELRGVSLREISDATRISVRFLRALEEGRLDTLPGGLFPKAFVRQYACHIGIDAEGAARDFEAECGVSGETPSPPVVRRRSLPLGGAFAGGVALLGLALAVFSAHRDRQAAEPHASVTQAASKPRPEPTSLATPSPRNDKLVLSLTAAQECWVRASADGHILVERVLQEGQSEILEAKGEIVLSVGNAGGLVVRVNDRPARPLGRSGEVKQNIMITPETATSMLEPGPDAPGPLGD